MSSGCHCLPLRLLIRDHDSQPATTDAANSTSNAAALAVRSVVNWIHSWATNATATVTSPSVAGQSLGLRKKIPDTTTARARTARTPRTARWPELNDASKPSQIPETRNKMVVRLRTLYLDGWIIAADSGGVNENGFPSAWLALVVPRCFFPVITSTGALTKFSTRMIRC